MGAPVPSLWEACGAGFRMSWLCCGCFYLFGVLDVMSALRLSEGEISASLGNGLEDGTWRLPYWFFT